MTSSQNDAANTLLAIIINGKLPLTTPLPSRAVNWQQTWSLLNSLPFYDSSPPLIISEKPVALATLWAMEVRVKMFRTQSGRRQATPCASGPGLLVVVGVSPPYPSTIF